MYSTKGLEQEGSEEQPSPAPTEDQWEQLLAPFPPSAIDDELVRSSHCSKRAILKPLVPGERILKRLNKVLGPEGFQMDLRPWAGQEDIIACELRIGAGRRVGLGRGSLESATREAIREAGYAFGMAPLVQHVDRYGADWSVKVTNRDEGVEKLLYDRDEG